MKKIILFVILQQYADWEAAYLSSALSMLGQGKYEIKTVSASRDAVQSIGGFKVMPDYDTASVPKDYEALILIGGMTWRSENTQQIKELAVDCAGRGKLLGGICDAAGFLGTAGVLNVVAHTGNDLNDIRQWAGDAYTGGANFIPKQAVRDKNIVSYHSWGEVSAEEFAVFLPYEKLLSKEEIHMYAMLWGILAEENSPLRAVVNSRVLSVPEDFYDFLIWKWLKDAPIKEARLIGDIIGHSQLGVGDWWYARRIEYYIQQGQIQVIEDSENKYARIICGRR